MATAVQVDGLSWLEPSLYQVPAGTPPIPSLQVAGADTGLRKSRSIWSVCIFNRA